MRFEAMNEGESTQRKPVAKLMLRQDGDSVILRVLKEGSDIGWSVLRFRSDGVVSRMSHVSSSIGLKVDDEGRVEIRS